MLEMRNKYAFWGVVLYIASSNYLIYYLLLSQNGIEDLKVKIWVSLYWLTMMFASINAVARSFNQESKAQQLYFYTIVNPRDLIISKMLYNFLFIAVLSLISLFFFILFLGNPIHNMGFFILTIITGATAYSFLFTMISGIAAKADNNGTLSAILGFPIVLPLIIYITKVSREAFSPSLSDDCWLNFGILVGFNILLFTLALILYPFVWRD